MHPTLNRRTFVGAAVAGAAGALLPAWPLRLARGEPVSPGSPHYETGTTVAATSTSKEATEAALWALAVGGNAADAYMTAALTQTVVEPGLTTIGGAFGITYFDCCVERHTRSRGSAGAGSGGILRLRALLPREPDGPRHGGSRASWRASRSPTGSSAAFRGPSSSSPRSGTPTRGCRSRSRW